MSDYDHHELAEVFTLYDIIMEACDEREVDVQDALTALTLVIKDMALNHHNPVQAREKTVLALDRAFELDEVNLPSIALH